MSVCKTTFSPMDPLVVTMAVATILLWLFYLPTTTTAGDLFSLVYKGCANQSYGISQQSLASLSSALIAQSSTSKFFKTTTSSSQGQTQLFGLFQCRGDLSPSDCSACITHIPSMWSTLCGQSIAARVQLTGCYGLYEVSGFPQVSGTKMLYKYCSTGNSGGGFEEKRDTAFASLQSGVVGGSGGAGFYATSYGSVYAMAQCEGDLSVADCGECVAEAVQRAEVECGGSSAGQMYLSRCYITYSYYAHGVPRDGGGGGGSGQPTGKTVAIVVGGAAGVGFLVICLLFVRSLYKKKDDL